MTKTFCDKCGIEIETGNHYTITLHEIRPLGNVALLRSDVLCNTCWQAVTVFIEGNHRIAT